MDTIFVFFFGKFGPLHLHLHAWKWNHVHNFVWSYVNRQNLKKYLYPYAAICNDWINWEYTACHIYDCNYYGYKYVWACIIISGNRYLASGEIQLNDADLHTVSQPTVSRAITDVLCALTSPQIVRQFIQFKTAPDHLREQCLQFNEIAGFPKVLNLVLKL